MDIKFANANEHIKVGKDKFLKEISSVLQEMPLEFSETVRFLRGWRNMTQEELAEDAGMDLKKLQRYEQGAARPGGIEPVIMLCIGLQLPYQISKRLLELSGYALTFSQQHMGYDIILQSCATSKSVSECNDVLKEMNCNELPVK